MLVSVLRNIGLATLGTKSELDIILEEQAKKLTKSPSIFVCNLNLEENTFSIEIEDLSQDKIDIYLPGVTSGNSRNYSPLFALKYQKGNDKDFSKLSPGEIINFKKIPDYNSFLEKLNEPIILDFFKLMEQKIEEICEELYKRITQEFTEEKDKEQLVVTKNAPKFIVFQLNGKYPGEIEAFRTLFLLQKSATKGKKKISDDEVVCIACGEKKEELFPLEKCSFFKFFSVDQVNFQLGFNKNAKQAMICKDCELLVRQGYSELDSTLKFEAYRLKLGEKKYKYIKHSIIPLSSDIETIQTFIKNISKYRRKIYESKKETLRSKIEELLVSIEKTEKSKKKEKKRQYKNYVKQLTDLKKGGELAGSADVDLRELLKQASENSLGIIDFYYEDVMAAGNPKKVVEDFIYGDRNQIKNIVRNLSETDEYYKNSILFNFRHLFDVYGEKTARLIIQSLFNEKKIRRKTLNKAAYNKIWKTFRTSLIKSDESSYLKWFVSEKKEIIHYTLTLLEKMNVLV
ncbi:MAG: TM1802 family CRISPR-associated protein [Candidatus Heimdallarchaeum endolithica]|uniref:TM1802 family CRISPR-associated protein n=1 Tax=Candidatus Heimdallarchaeum endolithica TaxID=2876572 RepID=A0A9Y1BSR0_9ARCH|nr:MAG: TM1802 family CRISPR-associated protein [Candidatus Heimdallarchaeum endolithica]